jgi:lipid II:glycine glycyltransferase (peptidoglycan interpeptide bridge formation enzyme)
LAWEARTIGSEEASRYDAFLAAAPKGHILQSYAWGQVKARTGWRPIYLVVEEEGRILAAALLLFRPLPVGDRGILYSPRGPVMDMSDRRLFDFLLERVRELGRAHGAILWKIDPDVPLPAPELVDYLRSRGFVAAAGRSGFEGTQPRCVFRLDLTPSLEELLAAFHPKTRYNLRLARRRGVVVKSDCRRDDLAVFYRLLTETARRDGFLIRGFSYFEALWEELVLRDYARLFLAYYEGEPIAGALAFTLGTKAWYIYGASANRHREVMPNYLLQWTMICWAKERGCTLYDFRGVPPTSDPSHPLHGLYRFKRGFSAQFTEFIGEYDLVLSPLWYRLWRWGEPRYRSLVRYLGRRGGGENEASV